jgi:molybdopterin/thiamine biosynthesis adenylyltransferase
VPSWTAARLLDKQLPRLQEALATRDRDKLREVKIEQGEPLTEFLPYEENSVGLIETDACLPPEHCGVFEAGILSPGAAPLRFQLHALFDNNGKRVWATETVAPYRATIRGTWVRMDAAPTELEPAACVRRLPEIAPEPRNPPLFEGVRIYAVVFPEELKHLEYGDGWFFLAHRSSGSKGRLFRNEVTFIRASRCGVSDMAHRVPLFADLQKCQISIAGLGCLGSPSAIEFARSGIGGLKAIEPDVVDAATVVRWSFGLTAAGKRKIAVILNAIHHDYPWVKLPNPFHAVKLGGLPEDVSEGEIRDDFLDGTNLIYDATAEPGLQYLLSSLSRERGLPYICLSVTNGGWGGVVARFNHREGAGCWSCFQAMLDHEIPGPAADRNRRCNQPAVIESPTSAPIST